MNCTERSGKRWMRKKPDYMQEQLSHATIERWLKKKAPGALHRLDLSLRCTGCLLSHLEHHLMPPAAI